MKKTFFIIISMSLFLCACSKKINGRIVDNFGKPVEGVEISIKDSASKVLSKSNGDYVLKYAVDEFALQFQKKSYLPLFIKVKISQVPNHSLGELRIIKLPDSPGVYLQDRDGYIKIPEVILPITTVEQINNGEVVSSQSFFKLPPEHVFPVGKDLSGLETVLVYGKEHYILVEPSSDGNVAAIVSGRSIFQEIKETVNHPGDDIEEHQFSPQFDKIYALINIIETSNSREIRSNQAVVFKYLKKQ